MSTQLTPTHTHRPHTLVDYGRMQLAVGIEHIILLTHVRGGGNSDILVYTFMNKKACEKGCIFQMIKECHSVLHI